MERSNLAALEFLMSKQPRGRVRIGTGNTVGARSSNVFDELDKFQARYEASTKKTEVLSLSSKFYFSLDYLICELFA